MKKETYKNEYKYQISLSDIEKIQKKIEYLHCQQLKIISEFITLKQELKRKSRLHYPDVSLLTFGGK